MNLPNHIGIIMDGNGRWAKAKGLPRKFGHKKGADVFKTIIRHLNKIGVKYVTVYAFSTENWKRPKEEIDGIIQLLREYLSNAKNYTKENIRTKFIGDTSVFDSDIIQKIHECEAESAKLTGLNLNIAINYGGQDEIINAVKAIVKDGKIENIDKNLLSEYLYTKGQPDVDLIIRPSGEMRLSNFMIWQAAYAEYIFMDVLWPDFTVKDLDLAIEEYQKRNRRFGGL